MASAFIIFTPFQFISPKTVALHISELLQVLEDSRELPKQCSGFTFTHARGPTPRLKFKLVMWEWRLQQIFYKNGIGRMLFARIWVHPSNFSLVHAFVLWLHFNSNFAFQNNLSDNLIFYICKYKLDHSFLIIISLYSIFPITMCFALLSNQYSTYFSIYIHEIINRIVRNDFQETSLSIIQRVSRKTSSIKWRRSQQWIAV